MEKRIGVVAILVQDKKNIHTLNSILTKFSTIIMGRMGLPFKDKGIQVISLIVEGDTDQIGAMTGQMGRLEGIQVKSILTPYREENHEPDSEN